MEEAISLDLNGKLALKLRLVRGQVVVARTGWADRLAAGQFLKIVDPHGKQAIITVDQKARRKEKG